VPREVLVRNGHFAVARDEKARIRDFYFPYVGLENHAVRHQFRFGIWVDGKFEWLDKDWNITMTYMLEMLTTRYIIKNDPNDINMEVNDAIHNNKDVFLRKIKVVNEADINHEVRLFFTQDFHIYGYEAGDRAFFEPSLSAIIHYKGKRYFLVGGATSGTGFYHMQLDIKRLKAKREPGVMLKMDN
jgi:GH15 family glucan-1,4-alpha-glucosidase